MPSSAAAPPPRLLRLPPLRLPRTARPTATRVPRLLALMGTRMVLDADAVVPLTGATVSTGLDAEGLSLVCADAGLVLDSEEVRGGAGGARFPTRRRRERWEEAQPQSALIPSRHALLPNPSPARASSLVRRGSLGSVAYHRFEFARAIDLLSLLLCSSCVV